MTVEQAHETTWPDLCVQLAAEFPEVRRTDVIAEVARSRSATELFGLAADEQLRTAAAIARNNLAIAGGGADLARLDPERHLRRARLAD